MSHLRVLILEDERRDAELMVHALEGAGFACEWVLASSQQEFASALDPGVEIILSDYSLPGFTALGALDLLHDRGIDIPLVVVTASQDEETAAECVKRGASDYVLKDHLFKLAPAVSRLLDERRLLVAQRATERRNATLSAAVEHSAAAIIITDRQGAIEYVNPQFTAITGYSAAEAVGQNPRILKSGLHPTEFYAELWHTVLSGREWRGELANRKKSGELYWEQASISPVIDKDGAITHIVAVKDDVTARRVADEALRQNQVRTELALDAARMGIWEFELPSGRLTWSDSLATALGLTSEQTPRTNEQFYELIHPDDRSAVQEGVTRAIYERTDLVTEFRIVRPDKSVRWVAGRARGLVDAAGQPTGMVGVGMDITERKSLEEQLRQSQKMEAIGQLAGGVAHDFNNLLTAILGYANLLSDAMAPDDDARQDLDEIAKAAHRAAELTRQLLAFSRKQVFEASLIDLNALVGGTVRMLGRLIGEPIELTVNLTPDLWTVRADPTQIEQVIVNLAVNARDAMPEGGRLIIETSNVELDDTYVLAHGVVRPGSYVVLSVSDTGVGMDTVTRLRLFEPFFTTKEKGQGTGLGLATVYGIVKQSGGYIWVYSEPNQGATFKVYLPAATGEPLEDSTPVPAERRRAGTETVMVVEDERAVRLLIRVILERAGYRVFDAAGPEEAERLFDEHADDIDLLITDVIMPGSSGPDMYERLAARRPGLKVLYISGYTDDTIVRDGHLMAGVAFMQKPFSADRLTSKVREVLES